MKVTHAQTARFSQELGGLLSLGYSLEEAVAKAGDYQSPGLKKICGEVTSSLQSGNSFTESLEPHKGHFPIFHRLVAAAEEGGQLTAGLTSASEILGEVAERRNRCFLAALYPGLVATVAILGGLLLLIFCGGMFTDLFLSMNLSLPLPTRVFLGMSELVTSPLGLLVIFGALALLWATILGWGAAGRFMYVIPLFGRWLRQQEGVLYLATVGLLLEQGAPLVEACRVGKFVCSETIQWKLESVSSKLESGDSLSKALESTGVFSDLTIWVVGQREATEDLKISEVAGLLRRELDCTHHIGSFIFEPLVFIFVLGGIGGFILSVFLPLYQLIGNLG